LVGVHDKHSEFAERAVHEWTAEEFAAPDAELSAQYRLMIRTEREEAEGRGTHDKTTIAPYADGQLREIGAAYAPEPHPRRGAGAGGWRRAPVVGGCGGGRRGGCARGGTPGCRRHGVLARRDGHGCLRGDGAAARVPATSARTPFLPRRRPERPRRATAPPLG